MCWWSAAVLSLIHILRNIPGKGWIYAQHWTLGRLEKDHFVTMNHAGLVFEKETLELFLPVGIYRLIAVKRLLNGDQEDVYKRQILRWEKVSCCVRVRM